MLKIVSNGSRGAGEERATIDDLVELLAREPLDPTFERYGNFVHPARRATTRRDPETFELVYDDAGPLFPEAPDAVSFFGNFFRVSAVFSIYTDEPEVIERLTTAIRANQVSAAYQSARP